MNPGRLPLAVALALAIAIAIALVACNRGGDKTSALREAQKQRAVAAKEDLFTTLSARLKGALESDGPAAAIGVCAIEAISITETIGKKHALTIGRTSKKLRNEGNVAPPWAQPLIDNDTAEPTFVSLANGELGALFPIKLKKLCETCHGDPASFPADLSRALAESYPGDRATGFAEGDLRGWFWVEVPARR